jgi:hypothetical protein
MSWPGCWGKCGVASWPGRWSVALGIKLAVELVWLLGKAWGGESVWVMVTWLPQM